MSIMTKDVQNFDSNSFGNCAQFMLKNSNNTQEKVVNFL